MKIKQEKVCIVHCGHLVHVKFFTINMHTCRSFCFQRNDYAFNYPLREGYKFEADPLVGTTVYEKKLFHNNKSHMLKLIEIRTIII